MKLAIGADHRGADNARALAKHLTAAGHNAEIIGLCDGTMCDYPDHAYRVAKSVADGAFERGILLCGTGIGMSIAANKVPGIRAALVHDEVTAEMSRRHNDANVLCLSGELNRREEIIRCVNAWINSEFEGGRHDRRLRKIAAIEQGEDPATIASEPQKTSA